MLFLQNAKKDVHRD